MLATSLFLLTGSLLTASEPTLWRAVHYYTGHSAAHDAAYGNASKITGLDKDIPRQWHSQAGQDRAVATILGWQRGGFFVDLAANHPTFISNTRALERDLGWSGLCIDGNERLVAALAARRRCTVVSAIVSQVSDATLVYRNVLSNSWETGLSGVVSASEAASASSGSTNKYKPWWRSLFKKGGSDTSSSGGAPTELVTRTTVTLSDILDWRKAPKLIEYLSLDVEGHEWEVIGAFPFDRYAFKVITIERPSDRIKALLTQHNYSYARHLDWNNGDDIDEMWVHPTMAPRIKKLLSTKHCGCCCRRGTSCDASIAPCTSAEQAEDWRRRLKERRKKKAG